jgi:hypothetical protein
VPLRSSFPVRATLAAALVATVAVSTVAPSSAAQRAAPRRAAVASAPVPDDLGPEMHAYMGFLEDEEAELEHLHDVGEVSDGDFRATRNKLAATRVAALRIAAARRDDVVPELYVLRESELTQVLPEGIAGLRGKRVGAMVDDDWLYHGTIRKGDLFYVLERIQTRIERARPF